MIRWRDPMSLAALVLVPALALFLLWSQRRRRQALETFVAAALLPAVAPDLDPRRRTIRAALLCGAVLALAVALGGPMWGFRWQQVQREASICWSRSTPRAACSRPTSNRTGWRAPSSRSRIFWPSSAAIALASSPSRVRHSCSAR